MTSPRQSLILHNGADEVDSLRKSNCASPGDDQLLTFAVPFAWCCASASTRSSFNAAVAMVARWDPSPRRFGVMRVETKRSEGAIKRRENRREDAERNITPGLPAVKVREIDITTQLRRRPPARVKKISSNNGMVLVRGIRAARWWGSAAQIGRW